MIELLHTGILFTNELAAVPCSVLGGVVPAKQTHHPHTEKELVHESYPIAVILEPGDEVTALY